MSQGIFCDLIVTVFDIMENLITAITSFLAAFGLENYYFREQLGLGSIFGCNL